MKSKKLLRAISHISDSFIEEAAPQAAARRVNAESVLRLNRFIPLAASLVLLITAVATVFPLLKETPPTPPTPPAIGTPQTQSPEAPLFHGFVLTAYAAGEAGEALTANFMSDTTSIILQPDVEVLLATYSPLMSSVPGLPFTFDVENGDYAIKVTVNNGQLCKWNQQTGVVTNYGNEIICSKGETLYWTPFDTDVKRIESTAIITVSAMEDNKVVGKQDIFVTVTDDYCYKARIGKLEIM